ncbi:MAG: copper-binding protein, partial [Acidobacteriota bacterium]|nr:copper-binding protein [Acidobacteriota bacterium]
MKHHGIKLKFVFITITLLLSLTADNCGGAKPQAQVRRFDLKGKIVSFDKGQQQIIIAHEDIPGLMEAMTMPFTLRDADA